MKLWIVLNGAVLMLMVAFSTDARSADRLQGDPQAVDAIERMLERLGGREVWQRTRTLYVEYLGWRTGPAEPVIERAWRDLQQPNQLVEFEGRSFETIFRMTREGSWLTRGGETSEFSTDRHQSNLAFWPYDFYTIIHNFAVADERIRLEFVPPHRVVVTSNDGADWGWWEIDSSGAPLKWGAPDDDGESLEYVYGPVKSFGNVNFPAWGASLDASWRFNYVAIDVSTDEIPVSLSPSR